jgi:hypothetical protein
MDVGGISPIFAQKASITGLGQPITKMSQINPYNPIPAMPAQRDRSQDRPLPKRRGERGHHEPPQDTLEQSDAAVKAAAEDVDVAALPEKESPELPRIDLTA